MPTETTDTGCTASETDTTPSPPTRPANHALMDCGSFISLDPTSNLTFGETKEDMNTKLTNFLGSPGIFGGADLPEAGGACLHEPIRSDWYDIQSAESKFQLSILLSDKIVSKLNDVPTGSYIKVTNIPIVVFRSDAAINILTTGKFNI